MPGPEYCVKLLVRNSFSDGVHKRNNDLFKKGYTYSFLHPKAFVEYSQVSEAVF